MLLLFLGGLLGPVLPYVVGSLDFKRVSYREQKVTSSCSLSALPLGQGQRVARRGHNSWQSLKRVQPLCSRGHPALEQDLRKVPHP